MKAIRIERTGGPEVMEYQEVERPEPRGGEVRVRLEAIGVNFLDVYHRTGLYPVVPPFIPGSEGAGVVDAVGEGVDGVAVGQRVVFSHLGTYAEQVIVPAQKVVPVPDGVDGRLAAAAFLQGLTAHFLSSSVYPLKPGDRALVHAAAGGVGGLLVQMAKARGATVYGTASTAKLDAVRAAGADLAIDYTHENFLDRVLAETGGAGVQVVYDSVGATTFEQSLDCVAVRGLLACFGQSSGPPPPVDVLRLARRGIYLTRPGFGHYTTDRDELLWRAGELFDAIGSGSLTVRIDREIPLRDAGRAHLLLERRQTSGKLILIP